MSFDWNNSVEIAGYPYRAEITMENFIKLLRVADASWMYADGADYYAGRTNQAAMKKMAEVLGPEAQVMYDEIFNPNLPPAA